MRLDLGWMAGGSLLVGVECCSNKREMAQLAFLDYRSHPLFPRKLR
jgi:hypothetical protein